MKGSDNNLKKLHNEVQELTCELVETNAKLRQDLGAARDHQRSIQNLIDEQREDPTLWGIGLEGQQTVTEAKLAAALARLHERCDRGREHQLEEER